MLVLSRKIGEEIIIDGKIRIVVNRISGSRVSLAVDAPSDVRVMRGELQPLPPEPEEMPIAIPTFQASEPYANRVG